MKKNWIYSFLTFLFLITIWEISSRVIVMNQFILPPPSSIIIRIGERPDRFIFHASITLCEMAGGVLLAFTAAFPLARVMSVWNHANFVLQPIFVLMQCVPMFALAPIMVIWFGWGYTAIVIPTALMIFFPLTMNIYQGLRSTPLNLLELFRINQATAWQTFSKLQLPFALPQICSGLRISAAIAGIGAVAGEWAGAQSGLGLLMLESRRSTDLQTTFGALFCLMLLSFLFYGSVVLIEKILISRRYLRFPARTFACLLFAVLFLASCQSSSSSSNKETRLLLDWLPNPNHVPLYAGIEQGIFAKHGIDLQILKLHDPGDSVPYITSGQAEIAIYYTPNTIRTNCNKKVLKPIGVLVAQPLNSIIFRSGEGISSPADLSEKVIGYCEDGSSLRILEHLLQKKQITPKAIRNVTFDLVSTLGTKQVDALYGNCWNIECEHLRYLGIETEFFDLVQLGYPKYLELIFIAKEDSLQAKPSFVLAFQKALQESISYSIGNSEKAFEAYVKANPDKSLQTIEWEKKAWIKTIPVLAKKQEIDQQEWSAVENWLKNNNLL